jgi:hypothetical protein
MKTIKRWFKEMFDPDVFNDMNTAMIGDAFNDPTIRGLWLAECFEEIKRINMEVDMRLLSESTFGLTDLCARRKAYRDVLESVLSIRRRMTQEVRPNPRAEAFVNLDRVTA